MKTKIFFALLTLLVLFRVEFSIAQSNDSIPREDGTKVAMPSLGQVTIVTKKEGSIKKCNLSEISPDKIVYEAEGCLHDLFIEEIVRIEINATDAIFFDENNRPMIKSTIVQYNSGLKKEKMDPLQNHHGDDSFNKCQHLIGIGAGFTTGCGFSYRLYFKNIGTQLNISPSTIFNRNRLNLGLTLLGRINQTEKTNLYLYFSNHLSHKTYREYDYSSVCDSTTYQYPIYNSNWVTKTRWDSGLGFDFEFNTKNRIKFNLMLGLAAYDSFKTAGLTGEFGLHYKIGKSKY